MTKGTARQAHTETCRMRIEGKLRGIVKAEKRRRGGVKVYLTQQSIGKHDNEVEPERKYRKTHQ